MPDRMHQVCLTQTDTTVNEKGVVSFTRRLRGREASRMGKLVARTNDEFLERVFRIKRILYRLEIQEVSRTARRVTKALLRWLQFRSCRGGETLLRVLEQLGIGHVG